MSEAAPEQAPPQNTNGSADVNVLADGVSDAVQAQILEQERKAAAQQLAKIRKQTQTLTSDFDDLKTKLDDLRKEEDALRAFVNEMAELKVSAEEKRKDIETLQQEATGKKGEIDELIKQSQTAQTEINSAKEKVSETQTKIAQDATKTTEEIQKLASDQEALKLEVDTLRKERDSLQTLINEIKQYRAVAEENKNSVATDIQTISQTKQQFEDMHTQAQATRDDLTNKQGEVAGKITEINTAYDRVTQQHAALFDDKANESGATIRSIINQIHDANLAIKNSLDETKRDGEATKKSLEELKDAAKTDIEDTKSKFGTDLQSLTQKSTTDVHDLRTALEKEIRSLLPGAGAAGLASAYVDAKARYAPGKFEYTGDRNAKHFWVKISACWLWHALISSVTPLLFYGIFLGPLLFIAYYFYEMFNTLKDYPQEFNKDLWLFRGLLSLPLATISLFGWSSIRLYRRLYEEYNHKQRVMQLYHSFKKEIEQHGSEDHQKALLGVMLAAVGDKPSLAMHRYDKGMETLWPNFSLSGLLSNLFKGKKDI